MAQALNTAYPDLTTTEHIPDEQRIFDRDKIIINYAKGRLNNMRIMLRRFADQGKKATKDMHVKYKSDIARQAMITSTGATLAADVIVGTIWFKDSEAQLVDDGAVLILRDNYYNGTNYSPTLVATNSMPEALLVLGRGNSDGTNTPFTVERAFGWANKNETDINAIAAGAIVLVQPTSVGEGSNEGRVWGDTPEEEYTIVVFSWKNMVNQKYQKTLKSTKWIHLQIEMVQELLMFYSKKWKWMLLMEEEIHVLLMVEEFGIREVLTNT